MSDGDVNAKVGGGGMKKSTSSKGELNKRTAIGAAYGGGERKSNNKPQQEASSKKSSSNGKSSTFSVYMSLFCAIWVLCGTYAWGKNAKGTPIYINQHADHACENFARDVKGQLLKLKNVDKNVVKGLDLSKGCMLMDVTRHAFPERLAKFQKHVKSHYTHSGGLFSSGHGETPFANTALVHTLVESVLPIGTFMMGIGSWLTLVNLSTGLKTYGLDFLSCGTFLVIMALMCGTTEGLTMEGYVASFIIMAAIKLDTNTCFLSYKQLLFYSISITIALYHSNDV